jgi:hypothetical protein
MQRFLTLLFFCCCLFGQTTPPTRVAQLFSFVRSEIEGTQHSDKQIAAKVLDVHLTERLVDEKIRELQAIGAGPRTAAALGELRDKTKTLPLPPAANE